MRRSFLALVLAAALVAAFASSAAAAGAWGSNGCGTSEQRPTTIVFSCGDGSVIFETEAWSTWGFNEATASGYLKHPNVDDPSCARRPISACPIAESAATVRLWQSSFCPSNSRWQFLRLRLDAPDDVDPELRRITQRFKCSEYAKLQPPREPRRPYWRDCGYPDAYALETVIAHRVNCAKARRLIRKVWRTSFPGGPGDVQRVGGFRCVYSFPGGKRPISCKRGSHKVRGPFAGGGD